jgi:hypothetical protein
MLRQISIHRKITSGSRRHAHSLRGVAHSHDAVGMLKRDSAGMSFAEDALVLCQIVIFGCVPLALPVFVQLT